MAQDDIIILFYKKLIILKQSIKYIKIDQDLMQISMNKKHVQFKMIYKIYRKSFSNYTPFFALNIFLVVKIISTFPISIFKRIYN